MFLKEAELDEKEQEIVDLKQRIIKNGKATLDNASSADISEARKKHQCVNMIVVSKCHININYIFCVFAICMYAGNL